MNVFRIAANSWDLQTSLRHFLPTLYCLHGVTSTGLCRFNEETGEFILPMTMSLTAEMLEETGIYLMDAGDILILYVRRKARAEDKELFFSELPGEKKNDLVFTERMTSLLGELNR